MGFQQNSPDPELVERVQNLQRTDPADGKLKWMSYSLKHGQGKYDPRAHSDEYILAFFSELESGSIEIDPQLKDSSSGPLVTNEIFVGSLPQDALEEEIQHYFVNWGTIKKIDYKPNRGFCFVTFSTPEEVDAILERHAEHMIREQWVDCKRAEDRRGGKGKGGKKGGFKGDYSKGGYSKGYDSWDGGFSKGGKKGGFKGDYSKGGKKGYGGKDDGYQSHSYGGKGKGGGYGGDKGYSGGKGCGGDKGYGGGKGWGKSSGPY